MNLGRARLPITIGILALACVLLVVLLMQVASGRPLTHFETIAFQLLILSCGITASYLFSQKTARLAGRPHARSAFSSCKGSVPQPVLSEGRHQSK